MVNQNQAEIKPLDISHEVKLKDKIHSNLVLDTDNENENMRGYHISN